MFRLSLYPAMEWQFCGGQVAVYNYMKLQVIRQKAALSTSKDAEKDGTGTAKGGSAADGVANGSYSNFRCELEIPVLSSHPLVWS